MERIPIYRSPEERRRIAAERLAEQVLEAVTAGENTLEVTDRDGSRGKLHEPPVYAETAEQLGEAGVTIAVHRLRTTVPLSLRHRSETMTRPLTYDVISVMAVGDEVIENETLNTVNVEHVAQLYP